MTHKMVTGSSTATGAPIYLVADGSWSNSITEGHATSSDDELLGLLEKARQDEFTVCDPYPIDVSVEGAAPQALSLREKIRAEGPTITMLSDEPGQ